MTTMTENPVIVSILDQLQADLTAKRSILPQVLSALMGQYELADENVVAFFETTYPTLDDVAIDLLFSPQYTPTTEDRCRYMMLLKETVLTSEELSSLVEALNQKQLSTTLVLHSEQAHAVTFPLHEEMVSRYVGRLYLDKPVAHGTYEKVVNLAKGNDETFCGAMVLLREPIWQKPHKQVILHHFLEACLQNQSFTVAKLEDLANFAKTYRPESVEDLKRQLVSLIESCEEDITSAHVRSYHDEQLKDQYAEQVESDYLEADVIQARYFHTIQSAQAILIDLG